MNWIEVRDDDPETMPELDVPVFVVGPNLRTAILVRSEVERDEGELVWAWCDPYGDVWYDETRGKWAVWTSSWDDDYKVTHWHPFPEPLALA